MPNTTAPLRAGWRRRTSAREAFPPTPGSTGAGISSRCRNVFLKIHLDANRRRIHTPRLRGAVAACRLTEFYGESEAHKQQSPPVAGRDAGRNRGNSCSRKTESPRNQAPSQAEKTTFPQRAVLRRFPALPCGQLCTHRRHPCRTTALYARPVTPNNADAGRSISQPAFPSSPISGTAQATLHGRYGQEAR